MDPTNEDMEWMTERARALVATGLGQDEAIAKALEEGEARARRRRAEEWQKDRAVEESLRDLKHKRAKRDRADGKQNGLRATLGDVLATKKR